ncbi:MAG: hypothetical protein ACK58T_03495, partial [Phycisphaerae bacterium]
MYSLGLSNNGDLIAGGDFLIPGNNGGKRIARWTGTQWSGFGSGLSGSVYSLAVRQNNDVIAGGAFSTAGGRAAARIARWNGTAWSALGAGIGVDLTPGVVNAVHALKALPNGELVVGGNFTRAGDLPSSY